jgi:hypothetical protein
VAKHWKTLIFADHVRLLAVARWGRFPDWPVFRLRSPEKRRPAKKSRLKTYQIFIFISSRAAAYSYDCLAVVCLLLCLSSVHLEISSVSPGFLTKGSEKGSSKNFLQVLKNFAVELLQPDRQNKALLQTRLKNPGLHSSYQPETTIPTPFSYCTTKANAG